MAAAGQVLVFDNGGCTLRAGLAGEAEPVVCMPNYTATPKRQVRALVGDEIESKVKDASQLFVTRPCDRGYVVNWECQKQLWDRALATHMNVTAEGRSLLLTMPPIVPAEIMARTCEVVFEEYKFDRLLCVSAAEASALRFAQLHPESSLAKTGCGLVLDSGFSFTHAVPIVNRRCFAPGVVRLDVGGKLLTNYLKELVSYRQWNMMEDTAVVNQVKEALCFVAQRYDEELAACDPRSSRRRGLKLSKKPSDAGDATGAGGGAAAGSGAGSGSGSGSGDGEGEAKSGSDAAGPDATKGSIRAEFVLPDFKLILKGFVKGSDGDPSAGHPVANGASSAPKGGDNSGWQVLAMNNERIAVPEVLFRPIDIGINQCGVVEVAAHSIASCPSQVRVGVAGTVVVCGGNAKMPGFAQRVSRELRAHVPSDYDCEVAASPEPLLGAWKGASTLAASGAYAQRCVTRAQYLEHGQAICDKKFALTAP